MEALNSSNTGETISELYHRLTSYSTDRHWLEPINDPRLRLDFMPMSPVSKPQEFKHYDTGLPRVQLPVTHGPPAGAVELLGRPSEMRERKAMDVGTLSAIIHQCAAVTRYSQRSNEFFRAASSAGNRHPLELYVCSRGLSSLVDGVWYYAPRRHQLVKVGPPPDGEVSALVVSGVPWRSCWKYSERGYRYMCWDCGTLVSQALLAAHAHGLQARLETAFTDSAIGRLIGAAGDDEVPLAVIPLGQGAPAVTPTGAAVPGDLGATEEFSMVSAIHRAGNLAGADQAAAWRHRRTRQRGVHHASSAIPEGAGREPLGVLVAKRKSARQLDPQAEILPSAVQWITDVASAELPWDAGDLHDVRVIVHSVSGLAPGVYRPNEGALEWIRPGSRATTCDVCLGQELGRDASIVLFITPFPGPGIAPDARDYRAAMIAAGVVLGRVYLAAMTVALGCCGLTFVDSLLPAAAGSREALAAVAIGRPVRGS